MTLSGLSFEGGLGEVCLAVAAVLLAAEALRESSERRQIVGLIVAAGLVHGGGVTSSAPPAAILEVLGIDTAMAVLAVAIAALGKLMTARHGSREVHKIAAYVVGGLAVASALALVFSEPVVDATAPPRTRLPEGASSTSAAARGQPSRFQHSPPQPIRAWRPVCGPPEERTAASHRRRSVQIIGVI